MATTAPSRLRKRQQYHDDADTEQLVASSDSVDQVKADDTASVLTDAKRPKTYGRTPDGTVFVVPTTHDMVSQLLDPRQPKNLSDLIVISILAIHILAAYVLPTSWKMPVFALVFLFWRVSYNVGIGVLLHIQSNYNQLVAWAVRWQLFQDPKTGKNPRPWLYKLLKRELEAKIPQDYEFEKAPIEYNTWLVFRRVVDLILMCDFTSYCLFAIVCGRTPQGEHILVGVSRWVIGIVLIGFNLWVKLDAHRVVKDFAWYWGDFFYLIDQDLTFDGVFEMAPHPMYSIGYAGYYGISMMAASYEVLFISIAAHAAQFAFLVIVENPHIEKTYNPPPPRRRTSQLETGAGLVLPGQTTAQSPPVDVSTVPSPKDSPETVYNLVGLGNMDLFRVPDIAVVLMPAYVAILTLTTPSTPLWQATFVGHALLWRVWYHVGLGILLDKQSKTKMWTRHFVKYGETAQEAWRQWKGMHHVTMIMCNASFIAACWKMYSFPADWGYGLVLLKHIVGASLVTLQLWSAFSVYESLGEFGWFCGDYFLDHQAKLTYTSIYRFVNNPERVFGIAGLWGAALITWSRAIFVMALAAQLMTNWFISYVERPHMQKIYGRGLRDEAGLTKFIKRSLPPPVKTLQESMDRVLDDTTQFVHDFLDTARPKFASGVKTIVRDTSAIFNIAPARLTLTRISSEVEGLHPKLFSLKVDGKASSSSAAHGRGTGKDRLTGRPPEEVKTMAFEYGTPLRVKWTAPANHSSWDWIGLYMVSDNRSRDKTEVSSLGRWVPTNAESWGNPGLDSSIIVAEHKISGEDAESGVVGGEVVFDRDRLWWTLGVFEFRYHNNGHHRVMAVSEPFEIVLGKFGEEDMEVGLVGKDMWARAVESTLLPVVRNCLDNDPEIAPKDETEVFGSHVERDGKYAKRIVYAVGEIFGIEFTPAVVLADRNVRKLAWRIFNAKQVLAPYSLSQSKGTTTPVG